MGLIKVGLASFGMSGQVFHAPFIEENPNFILYKIVERTKNLSTTLYPNAIIVRDFDDLISDPDIDLIVVNTPDSTHFEYTYKALEKGKHVIVEKPFTSTVEQGKILISLACKMNKMLSVYQNRRWDSDFLTVQDIISRKILGELVEFESTFPRYRNFIKPNTWKETGVYGGGLTYNLGSHIIDQALILFGMPQAIYADIATLRNNSKVDDYFLIHLLHPSNASKVRITLKASYLMCEPEPRFILHGTLGSYIKHGFDNQEEALLAGKKPKGSMWGVETKKQWGTVRHINENNKEVLYKYPSIKGNYRLFYENIYEHLVLQKPLLTDATEVINVIKVIEAAYQSAKEQKIIQLTSL